MFLRASGNYDEIKKIFKEHLKEFLKLPEQNFLFFQDGLSHIKT